MSEQSRLKDCRTSTDATRGGNGGSKLLKPKSEKKGEMIPVLIVDARLPLAARSFVAWRYDEWVPVPGPNQASRQQWALV